jgi:hypothetical protein
LFVGEGGIFQEKLRKCDIFKKHSDKSFIFCTSDNTLPIIPGLYASLDRRFYNKHLHAGGFYLEDPNLDLIQKERNIKIRYLFSFMGNCSTHKCRDQILKLAGHESAMIRDVGNRAQDAWSKWDMDKMKRFSEEYSNLIQQSNFVLCPRGNGTTSIRLFETMKLGKVPVIISDNWVPPIGPDWDQFSIRVKENNISEIPNLLEKIDHRASEMGQRAEIEWNKWFSNSGCVKMIMNYLNGTCQTIGIQRQPMFRVLLTCIKFRTYNLLNKYM